jgi:hypothetical protein
MGIIDRYKRVAMEFKVPKAGKWIDSKPVHEEDKPPKGQGSGVGA